MALFTLLWLYISVACAQAECYHMISELQLGKYNSHLHVLVTLVYPYDFNTCMHACVECSRRQDMDVE